MKISETAARIMGMAKANERYRMDEYILSDWATDEFLQSMERFRQDTYILSDWSDSISEKAENYELEEYRPHSLKSKGSSLPSYFADAVQRSFKPFYLHPYTEKEFSRMRLYKIKGLDAGFAIKSDGDIVAVHNNSEERRLSTYLMREAKRLGGIKMDHFDSKLSKIYGDQGFRIDKREEWNDEFAPNKWPYEPIPLAGSSYERHKNVPPEVAKRYRKGRPDIVYRSLRK